MEFIIVWRARHRDPHIDVDSHGFKEYYSSYELAEKAAKEIMEREGDESTWYFDYQIFELANG